MRKRPHDSPTSTVSARSPTRFGMTSWESRMTDPSPGFLPRIHLAKRTTRWINAPQIGRTTWKRSWWHSLFSRIHQESHKVNSMIGLLTHRIGWDILRLWTSSCFIRNLWLRKLMNRVEKIHTGFKRQKLIFNEWKT